MYVVLTNMRLMLQTWTMQHIKDLRSPIESEYGSQMENHTWDDLVEFPADKEAIPCKWVFKVKHKKNGIALKGMSRGMGQTMKKPSPLHVVRFSSIRILLAFALQNGMLIHQMDVVMASLIKEEMYMVQHRFCCKRKGEASPQIAQISVWLLEQGIPGV